jgi:hypothetical protein
VASPPVAPTVLLRYYGAEGRVEALEVCRGWGRRGLADGLALGLRLQVLDRQGWRGDGLAGQVALEDNIVGRESADVQEASVEEAEDELVEAMADAGEAEEVLGAKDV